MRHRRAEERHHAIAEDFVEVTFVFVDFVDECLARGVDEIVDLFGIQLFGDGGESADVGKEDRDGAPFTLDLFAGAGDFFGERGGDGAGQEPLPLFAGSAG